MRVTIAPTVFLVSPLVPGQDLHAGDTVEVADAVGQDWIGRGWASADDERTARSAERDAQHDEG